MEKSTSIGSNGSRYPPGTAMYSNPLTLIEPEDKSAVTVTFSQYAASCRTLVSTLTRVAGTASLPWASGESISGGDVFYFVIVSIAVFLIATIDYVSH